MSAAIILNLCPDLHFPRANRWTGSCVVAWSLAFHRTLVRLIRSLGLPYRNCPLIGYFISLFS